MKPRNTQNIQQRNLPPQVPRILCIPWSENPKSGMTLIELIVTLTIMAAVASIAIVTLSDMGATSRYEETERRGLAAQRAVIGQPGEISRFFNDMGRYPVVLDASDSSYALAELYDQEQIGDAYYRSIHLPATFTNARSELGNSDLFDAVTNVTMGAGWRGPYLLNRDKRFTDNWGNGWIVTSSNDYDPSSEGWTASAETGNPITGILSEGMGSDGYLAEPQVYPFYENSVFGYLDVNLAYTKVCTNSFVFLYVPDCPIDEEPDLEEIMIKGSGTFTNVPVGARKIWACALGTNGIWFTRPQTIEIKPGSNMITLYLNEESKP